MMRTRINLFSFHKPVFWFIAAGLLLSICGAQQTARGASLSLSLQGLLLPSQVETLPSDYLLEKLSPNYVLFSIEEPYSLPTEGNHGDILVYNPDGLPFVLPGGFNRQLASRFLDTDQFLEHQDVGLDGFDVLELDPETPYFEKSQDDPWAFPNHKIIFTIEDRLLVSNPDHPLVKQAINDGDLLLTNGGVILNQTIIAPIKTNLERTTSRN